MDGLWVIYDRRQCFAKCFGCFIVDLKHYLLPIVLWFGSNDDLFSHTRIKQRTRAHDEHEKDQIVQTIGPVWDGNEVWLLTAGGAMFASFPYWYASLFSGYYLILFIILFGLIIRGVSFEFRSHMPKERKQLWNWTLSFGSF